MRVFRAADAVVANTNTDIELPVGYDSQPEAFIQIEISGTFTVQVLGRLSSDASYVELVAAVTANTIQPVTYMPYMRFTTTGGASTPIFSAWVMIGEGRFGKQIRVDG